MAIERRRAARREHAAKCSALDELIDDGIPEAKAELDRLHNAIDCAELGLVDAVPTTFAGAIAGLHYLAAAKDGHFDEPNEILRAIANGLTKLTAAPPDRRATRARGALVKIPVTDL